MDAFFNINERPCVANRLYRMILDLTILSLNILFSKITSMVTNYDSAH